MKKLIKKLMNPTLTRIDKLEGIHLLNTALARTGASFCNRNIDKDLPLSWECSGFSQNGEDGIIDYLVSAIKRPNKYFIEIGSNNGIENNTAYLAHVKKYSGLQIEGDKDVYMQALKTKPWLVDCLNSFVTLSSAGDVLEKSVFNDPDVFSIDIDGMDYFITKFLFEKGLRPKIAVVEYNSAFGPDRSISVSYTESFNMFETKFPYLYYGVSITGWKNFFAQYGYRFVTVESNGVNGFFIDPTQFDESLLLQIRGTHFAENKHQLRLFRGDHLEQFKKIEDLTYNKI